MVRELVEISGLTFSYRRKGFKVLNNLDLKISSGDGIIGLFGPNGAGKTTLMRCIAGQIRKYSGTLETPENKNIAYLPDGNLFPLHARVDEALAIAREVWADLNPQLALDLITSVSLPMDRRVGELSQGMRAQLNILTMLARSVDLFLFDEPLANVDPSMREKIAELFKSMRSPSRVIIISTHQASGVKALFDRVAVINEGKLVAFDPTDEIKTDLDHYVREVINGHLLAG